MWATGTIPEGEARKVMMMKKGEKVGHTAKIRVNREVEGLEDELVVSGSRKGKSADLVIALDRDSFRDVGEEDSVSFLRDGSHCRRCDVLCFELCGKESGLWFLFCALRCVWISFSLLSLPAETDRGELSSSFSQGSESIVFDQQCNVPFNYELHLHTGNIRVPISPQGHVAVCFSLSC